MAEISPKKCQHGLSMTKDQKRTIFIINKVLETLTQQEQNDLFHAMNIDPKSLYLRNEQEFFQTNSNPVVAKT